MKRIRYISFLLCAALLYVEAQVQPVYWSKKSAEDTAKTAWGPNLGILAKFVTFPDGTKMLTAAGFSDTTKYIEKTDSLAMPGYATRTMLGKDSTYARALFARDTTYRKAQEDAIRLDTVYARAIFALDTTYKAAELLKRILYSDTTSSLTMRWVFVRDSLYRAAQDLEKIKYSDTTSTVANQWRLGGYYARGDTASVLGSKSFLTNQYAPLGHTQAISTITGQADTNAAKQNRGENYVIGAATGSSLVVMNGNIMVRNDGAAGSYIIGDDASHYFELKTLSGATNLFIRSRTGNIDLMTIDVEGRIGIGMTSAPTEKTTIKGSTTTTDLMNLYRAGSTTKVAGIDSSGTPTFSGGLATFDGTNSATVTAGAGDSIQVSVTGVTITSQIVATYAATTALTDVPTGIRNRQTGKFTIQATNGKDVTYWIGKK